MDYTKETLDRLADARDVFIVEFNSKLPDIHIGYIAKSDTGGYTLYSLNQNSTVTFPKSYVKRIICLYTWRIINKDDINAKKLNYVDIFELNDLVKQAGYELI